MQSVRRVLNNAPSLQELHHYYELVRQRISHRYSTLHILEGRSRSFASSLGHHGIETRLLLFHADAADRAHVAYMPDTIWPEKRSTRQTHPRTLFPPWF